AIGDGALKPISAADAFGPEIDPRYTWYDEMLVSEDMIAVIGYSYERGGTEVGLFRIDRAGNLSYRSTYHLRSNDYYSSRNYASRLIGSKLIFYTPLYLNPESNDPFVQFPAVRKWHKGATPQEFQRIVSATHVYRAERQFDSTYGVALHTVTICDLAQDDFKCEATAVLGAPGDVALLRIPLSSFNDVSNDASSWDYHGLPKPSGYTFQNRFVGDYLLYGTGSGWGAPENKNKSNLFVVHWSDGDLNELTVAHGVDRIEALGSDAIVVGTDGNDLHFTAIRLGQSPEVADEYIRKGASQGELRSHGFFYKPDGPNSGVLGL